MIWVFAVLLGLVLWAEERKNNRLGASTEGDFWEEFEAGSHKKFFQLKVKYQII